MKVFDSMKTEDCIKTFPTGMAVLVMNSITDIIAVESVLHTSDSGMVRKMASQLKTIREQYAK